MPPGTSRIPPIPSSKKGYGGICISEIPPNPRSCEKFGIFPLPLPSPARGEGKHIEIQEEIPSPSTGEGQGGGGDGIFSHFPPLIKGGGGISGRVWWKILAAGCGYGNLRMIPQK